MVQASSQGATVTISIQTGDAVPADSGSAGQRDADRIGIAQGGSAHQGQEDQALTQSPATRFGGSGGTGGGGNMGRQITRHDREMIARALIARGSEMLMELAAEVEAEDDTGVAVYLAAIAEGALPNDYARDAVEDDIAREREEEEHEEEMRDAYDPAEAQYEDERRRDEMSREDGMGAR